LRIAETILAKVKQMEAQPVLHLAHAQIVQTSLPVPILSQIFRNMCGQKNMSRIATIQDSLRHIDSRPCHVRFLINIRDSVDRTAVNSHPQLDARMILQCSANLERTPGRFFRTVEENERHPIAGRHSNKFLACFRSAETLGTPHDLLQLLQQFNLLVHEQL
jgi:hypothetical protein